MATKSARTVRIRNISSDVKADDFVSSVIQTVKSGRLDKASRLSWKKSSTTQSSSGKEISKSSLAKQKDNLTATVTFQSSEIKAKALKLSPEAWKGWIVDDVFDGITVLHSRVEAEIEYVHVFPLAEHS